MRCTSTRLKLAVTACTAAMLLCITRAASLPRLCPSQFPLNGTTLHCSLDAGNFSTVTGPVPELVRILEYNVDENGRGGDGSRENGLKPIIALLATGNNNSIPVDNDFIVLSEVKRGCKSSNYVNGAAAIATALHMNYMFAVEYIDTTDGGNDTECTIGNAILSRYPFHRYGQLRYAEQCCTYGNHIGGRIAGLGQWVTATGALLSVVSTHLESGTYSAHNIIESFLIRPQQSRQAGHWALLQSLVVTDHVLIVAGDFNAPFQDYDPTLLALRNESFHDAHASLPWSQRITCPDDKVLMDFDLGTLDYIMGYPRDVFSSPGVASSSGPARGWSDHVPIWATMNLTRPMPVPQGRSYT